MKTTRTALLLLSLVLAAPFATGCAADATTDVEQGDEDLVKSGDAAILRAINDAVSGLETGGGEGDADPYRVTDVKLAKSEAMTDKVLLDKLLPKLPGFEGVDGDVIPGLDPTPIAKAWAMNTEDPNPKDYDDASELAKARADAKQWLRVKAVFDKYLTDVKYFDMGYRASPKGSLETGAVAHVFVGRTASGRIIAISGIDIWT